jgi:hypothetical protein
VTLVVIKGANDSVDVKKLPKKAAPARFGRRLTAAQKARATHLCIDCGYVSMCGGGEGGGGCRARICEARGGEAVEVPCVGGCTAWGH